jgi:hypothetical protein
MGVAVGTGVAAGVGRPCFEGSSPYLLVHPAQKTQARIERRRRALMAGIIRERPAKRKFEIRKGVNRGIGFI